MRFLVFAGDKFDSLGGWGDYKASYESYEDARSTCLGFLGLGTRTIDNNWSHVVDVLLGKIVFQCERITRTMKRETPVGLSAYRTVNVLHCVAWDAQGNMIQSELTL
jgi:hypothetical protein